jgi:branched-chain amino acid transport system substrate-binding protein
VNRKLIALLGAGALSLTVAACGSSDDGGSTSAAGTSGTSAASGGGTVKVGYAAALSGFLAPYDTPFYNALKIAVADQNAKGGLDGRYRIELDVKDVKSEIPVAAQVAQELVDGGAQVLITPCDADPSVAAGQPAQTAQIPAISGCAGSPRLPSSVGDYMFQNVFAVNSQVVPLAEYAVRDEGYRTAFLLYSPDTRYTNDGPVHFGEVFTKLGGEVVGRETYKFQSQDFGAQIAKIRAARPDVIMTSAYDPDLSAFLKQLRAAGVTAPVFGTDGADAPSLLRSAGKAADGLVFTTHGMPVPEEAKVEAFAKEYRAKTGNAPESAFVYAAPDLVAVLDAAVRAAGSLDGPALRDALDGLRGVEGTTGEISFAGMRRSPLKAVTLVKVEGGRFAFVDQRVPDPQLIPAPTQG